VAALDRELRRAGRDLRRGLPADGDAQAALRADHAPGERAPLRHQPARGGTDAAGRRALLLDRLRAEQLPLAHRRLDQRAARPAREDAHRPGRSRARARDRAPAAAGGAAMNPQALSHMFTPEALWALAPLLALCAGAMLVLLSDILPGTAGLRRPL